MKKLVESRLPVEWGRFLLSAYGKDGDHHPHLMLTSENLVMDSVPLVRVHSECMTGDVFGSKRCDCGEQLTQSMQRVEKEGGILIYLRQEGRGIGLVEKLKAYNLQDEGMDTIEANKALGHPVDGRSYVIAAEMLKSEGISTIKLLTNNPDKVAELEANGIQVIERVPLIIQPHAENADYLAVKKSIMGHFLD